MVAISSIGYLITKVLHIWHTGSPSRSPFGHLEGVANSNFGQSGGSSLMQAQSFHTFATQQEKLRKSPKGKLFLIGLLDNWVIWILVILFLSFYLTNHASNWLWSIPPLTYILYPFRFLFVTSFTGAILAGILVSHLGTRRNNYHATVRGSCAGRLGGGIAALILVGSALLQGRPYTNPYVDIFPFPDSYFKLRQTINSAPLTRKNMLIREFLPVQVSMQFLEQEEEKYYQEYFQNKQSRREEAFVSSGDGSIEIINNLSELLQMKLKAKDNVGLTINRFYFPNWQGSIDGKNVSIGKDKEGRMVLAVDKGMHEVTLRFGYSKIEKIANMITFFGLIIFAVEMLWIVSRYSI
ncbi:hypothetical protein FJY90_03770 [Candidatus Gottesmanbacteria bacterium]|nr:hypothetical protein [Candidatus Gottesmanbacteria bacterium]